MHLKSLTLKGFKSFAQATTFAFEPGVTCIVGPNGSGKSNVVDALAWVMGEQGAKNLRGGTMADVIFAGTATRGPLGRAEVVLTIDNADGALPIEYGEVAIARTLFRDGRSEYAINGESCRLLDVQELLSDSGLGREMHVIVGQGRLDAVLRATPDERRGFIEEAAGILKHRRRKERTLRKLEAMQANLTRLTDLAEELRRQLKPLGAQAEIAREAATIQAAVREARVRLLAHDAARLGASVAALEAERDTIGARRQVAEDTEHSLARRVAQLEQADGGELHGARRTALELESVQERMRALAQSAATRAALLAPEEAEPTPAATPMDEVRRSAAAIEGLRSRSAAADAAERAIAGQLASAQAALNAVDARIAAQAAAVGEHDRALARLASRVAAAESRLQSAWSDAERRRTTAAAAESRAADAARALADAPEAAEPHEHPGAADDSGLAEAIAAAEAAQAEVHRLERAQSAAEARLAALRAATAAPPTTAEVLAALPGSRRVQDTLEVDDGWSTAIAAALGPLLEAALLPDGDLRAAADRVAPLGAVDLVDGRGAPVAAVAAPPGALHAADVVRAPPSVLALLGAVLLVDDDAAAPAVLAAAPPGASVVARSGATFAAARLRTPGAAAGGVELTAQREATADEVEALAGRLIAARDVAARAGERVRSAQAASRAAAAERLERDRVARADGQRRATLAARSESAAAEARRLAQQAAEAQAALAAAAAAGDAAERELVAMRDAERPALDAAERPAAAAALQALQERSVAVRLESGTAHERLRAEQARLAALERRAEEAERAAAAAARRAALRRMQRQAVEEVLAVLPAWQASVDASVTAAGVRLAEAERQRAAATSELADGRRHLAAARDELTELDRGAREVDMRLYEQQLSRAAVLERAEAELGLAEAALAAEADPALDRGAEERRLSAAERQLARLGRVNPLALEEFRALEQRHAFLGEQLADLQRTRTDLLRIVDDLDERIATIFAAAYADTEAAFATIFPVLFPGGTGRLTLISADDTGVPGVEVAVRPAGKKIERLSLLSGGERSLAAIAFLLAIFTARPSPFYILDEVEAALDDANLGRLLEVIGSLRDASQLILITHQKRTMEIADSLYGVSMRQDGISTVIGQRLQRLTAADA